MATPSTEFTPPTYDLRTLGGGLEIYERLDRLADEYLALAEATVGAAFARVPEFSARAACEKGRAEEYYRATIKERYLVELLACVTMGRQFWPAFVARRDTVMILPDCLRVDPDGCQREETDCGERCTHCHEDCLISRITTVGERFGVDAYFSKRERPEQFKAMRKRYPDLSVLGVACIWMLAVGMRAAEEARIPSQGVLLNYSACEHWLAQPVTTDAVVERVEVLLGAKAALLGR